MSKSIQLKNKDNEKMYPNPYYPVGSIYLSVIDLNPTTWFGGTWEKIAKGRTLVGVDTNDTDFNTVKKTGGSKYLQDHHHATDYYINNGNNMQGGYDKFLVYGMPAGSTYYTAKYRPNVTTGNSGNLQPYFTCYIWCRTA